MEQNVAQLSPFERLWAWFETNKKQVLVGTSIVVIVGAVGSLYVWRQGEKETSASEDLSEALAPLTFAGGNTKESAEAFLKVAAEHPGTGAAGRAVLQAAGVLFTQGKYAEAQAQFERFIRENADSAFRVQAQLGVAACLDAQGKTDPAVQAYNDLVVRHPNENIVPQAKFALARIYESQNKLAEAFKLFMQIAQADTSGSIGLEAGLKAEELKTKYPALAAAAAPAPSSLSFPGLTPSPGTNMPKP